MLDARDPSIFHMRAAGREMSVSGSFATPEEPTLLLASRPLLEDQIRRRVLALDNVTVLDGHDVVDFAVIPADGWRAAPKHAVNVAMNVLWRAAARDIRITET